MPVPVLHVAFVALIGTAWWKSGQREREAPPSTKGVMTTDRQRVFTEAFNGQTDPSKLRTLAEAFRGEDLPGPAELLEKRAKYIELPQATKQAHREIHRKAMTSKNKDAILAVAQSFYQMGCIGAARSLREYAEALPPDDKHAGWGPTNQPNQPIEHQPIASAKPSQAPQPHGEEQPHEYPEGNADVPETVEDSAGVEEQNEEADAYADKERGEVVEAAIEGSVPIDAPAEVDPNAGEQDPNGDVNALSAN